MGAISWEDCGIGIDLLMGGIEDEGIGTGGFEVGEAIAEPGTRPEVLDLICICMGKGVVFCTGGIEVPGVHNGALFTIG